MRTEIYVDNAATTKMLPEVIETMIPYFSENYGNPSSVYEIGARSREAVMDAREKAGAVIGAKPEEIYFTSGGTESDNWVLTAVYDYYGGKKNHIITSKIEHHAILRTCEYLERVRGADVTYLPVGRDGRVDPDDVLHAIRPETCLISVMTANNEIGTIQPVREIGLIAKSKGVWFHTDAVQAYGHIPIDVEEDHIDFLSISAHKLGGPKGTGALYIRRGIKIGSFMRGGAQERNRRAGTENVPGIAGFGKAAEIAQRDMAERADHERMLRDHLLKKLRAEIPLLSVNGSMEHRLPGNLNVCVPYAETEMMVINLDLAGIAASGGSACASGSLDPSHVLLAIGLSYERAQNSVRFTISHENTIEEMDRVAEAFAKIVERLRKMSPGYAKTVKGKENL
ncbi:MAG TPA: cysteine desulfurase NifS [Lachnospiraceae bacterium]|nr:cysteine desulfurase NifS [Lachnospiraceae bacterium]